MTSSRAADDRWLEDADERRGIAQRRFAAAGVDQALGAAN